MTSIHPHWQTDDTEERGAPVDSVGGTFGPEKISVGSREVSRRPAAIAGMLVVTGLAVLFFYGVDELAGNLAENRSVIVRITANGLEPADLHVSPGDSITWINDQDIPHILESDTLCDASGNCLHTVTLFTGESDTFTIGEGIATNTTYEYFSTTAENVVGKITVDSGDTAFSETSTQEGESFQEASVLLEEALVKESASESVVTGEVPIVAQAKTTEQPKRSDASTVMEQPKVSEQNGVLIPRNPYTVDSGRELPYEDESLIAGVSYEERGATTGRTFLEGRGPMKNTETGPGIWITAFLSAGALLWLTRRSFAWR